MQRFNIIKAEAGVSQAVPMLFQTAATKSRPVRDVRCRCPDIKPVATAFLASLIRFVEIDDVACGCLCQGR